MKTYNTINFKKKYTFFISIILIFSIISLTNFIEAVVTNNLPISDIKYDSNDNSYVFPESYKPYIRNLKANHPNWTFKAVYTGLDWSTSISQESFDVSNGISTVPVSYSSNWKKDGANNYIDGSFVIASKKAVAYTLDPRNFLNDYGIFQFESLDYNAAITNASVEKILIGTPMQTYPTKYKRSGSMVDLENGLNWAQIIINASRNAGGNGISPIFLASRMKQETSLDLMNNSSINGSNSSYPGIYNFFNIGATPNPDGSGAIQNGLSYASSKGWTTPAASINAGASYIWGNYIKYGQNTTYFQKFDVNNPYGNAKALYAYQYMTNILAPSSESKISYSAYSKSSMLETPFVYYIPVYNNMPATISPHPDSSNGSNLVYLDDTSDIGVTDIFKIRAQPDIYSNIIATITETQEGAANRTKFTRVEIGSNGWDKIKLGDGTEGYVSQTYVFEYDNIVHVTDVLLNRKYITFNLGESFSLVSTVLPYNATMQTVSWSSSNSNVATVNANADVKTVGVGTAVLTATSNEGGKIATCIVNVANPAVYVKSVSLNKKNITLDVNEESQLVSTVLPYNATTQTVSWSSSNPNVATVNANAKVKAIGTGTAILTATSNEGEKTAICIVNVANPAIHVTGVTLNKTTLNLKLGETTGLVSTVLPYNATTQTVSWSSSNSNVVTINSNADVKAVGIGTAVLTATSNDGEKTINCTVNVTDNIIHVTGVTLNKTTLNLKLGQTTGLVSTVLPYNATTQTVSWSSSDETIVKINANADVKAVGIGTAVLTAKSNEGGKTVTCTVTVVDNITHVTDVTLNKTSLNLKLGQTSGLVSTVLPYDATTQTVSWSSSNSNVATVNANADVKAVGIGTAILTAKSNDGGKTVTCTVTVVDNVVHVTDVTLNKTSLNLKLGQTSGLVSTVLPYDATTQTVSWSSSNSNVATVNANADVKAVGVGTAVLTAKSNDGGKTVTCNVNVTDGIIHVTSVMLNKNTLTLNLGETSGLVSTALPYDATTQTVNWSSSNPNVATVNANADVKAVGVGTAILTAKSNDGGKTVTCTVNVAKNVIHVTSVTLNKTSLNLSLGQTSGLISTVLPYDATTQTVSWSSSNPNVATVNANADVKAVGVGTAVLTATSNEGGKVITCTVNVN